MVSDSRSLPRQNIFLDHPDVFRAEKSLETNGMHTWKGHERSMSITTVRPALLFLV
jgi:hypothetical protein